MKFLHDVIYKGSLTADGSITVKGGSQFGDSRLDVHNVYGALTVGNGSTGTDVTALTVKAMGTGASVNFQTLDVTGNQVFATLENGYILTGGTFRPTDLKTGFIFDAFVVSPLAFQIITRSNNTSSIYKGLVITEGNLNGISGGNFDTRYIEVVPTFNASGGGEYKVRGFYYNPTVTNLSGTTVVHTAWENTSGEIIHGNLAGTGTRMVVADSTGKLGVQTVPSFSETDTLDSVTDRGATTTNSVTLGGLSIVSSASGILLDSVAGGGSQWSIQSFSSVNDVSNAIGFYNPLSATTPLVITPTKIQVKNSYQLIWGFDDADYADSGIPDVGLAWEAANTFKITNGSTGYGGLKLNDLKVVTLAGTGTRMVIADANGLLSTQTIPTGSSTLSGLTDVTITTVADNQLLKYDSGTSKWINWTPNYLTSYTEIYQGTVTSVALSTGTSGTDINVSGSPITGSGTITLNIPNASSTARGVVSTGAQTFVGQKTFHSLTTTFDSSDTGTFLEGKASGVLYGGIAFSLFMQFNAYPAATQGFVWKNGIGNNVMALEQSGVLTVANLAGTGTRMVVASNTGVLSTQAIPSGGVSDGDKGDITVSSSGSVWTIDDGVIGLSKLSATGTPSSSTYLRGDNTWATITPGGSGTVTSVSVVSANGFAGTVATDTTTPAITLSTTVTGLLKGDGTSISAASGGTDYEVPLSFSNGLTRASNAIKLGGTISENTTLDGTDNSWNLVATNMKKVTLRAGTVGSVVTGRIETSVFNDSALVELDTSNPAGTKSGNITVYENGGTPYISLFTKGSTLANYYAYIQMGSGNLEFSSGVGSATLRFSIDAGGSVYIYTTPSLNNSATNILVRDTNGQIQYRTVASLGIGNGTVTSVSVVSANGFAGTVATDTTTPAITLSTTVTGILKGDGTGVTAAVAGTDYLVSNQTITLSGAVTGSGTTSIATTLANSIVGIANLSATGTPSASTFLRGDNTWATVSGGGGYSVVSATTTYNAAQTSGTVIIKGDTTSAGFSVNLPTAVGNQTVFIIKKSAGSAALIIDGSSTETIDGSTSIELIKVNESVTLVSDNTNWLIV